MSGRVVLIVSIANRVDETRVEEADAVKEKKFSVSGGVRARRCPMIVDVKGGTWSCSSHAAARDMRDSGMIEE